MRRRRRLLSDDASLQDLWPSFTDITSTIALILFVLVLLAYVRNLISGKQLDAYAQQIASSEKKLSALSIELQRTNRQISIGQAQLSASQLKLEEQQGIILESHRELDSLRSRLSSIALSASSWWCQGWVSLPHTGHGLSSSRVARRRSTLSAQAACAAEYEVSACASAADSGAAAASLCARDAAADSIDACAFWRWSCASRSADAAASSWRQRVSAEASAARWRSISCRCLRIAPKSKRASASSASLRASSISRVRCAASASAVCAR